jgi:hypothetical protein
MTLLAERTSPMMIFIKEIIIKLDAPIFAVRQVIGFFLRAGGYDLGGCP